MVQEIKKVFDAIHKLNYILSKEQKIYCVIVFILSLISAILELLGVSIVIPLMSALLYIDELRNNAYASKIFVFFTWKQIYRLSFLSVVVWLLFILLKMLLLFFIIG